MRKIRVLFVFGTRPEAIKMAPLIKEMRRYPKEFDCVVCVTAQHRKMLDQVLSLFEIIPDIDLGLMKKNQTLGHLTASAMTSLTTVLADVRPNVALVQGDTTTAMVAAQAAFYHKIPVGHVEAGLRTYDMYNPFPEEINRRLISTLASFHFAPTKTSFDILIKEGYSKDRVFLTGNTVVDALKEVIARKFTLRLPCEIGPDKKLILVTAHRRENFGKPLKNICVALKEIVKRNSHVVVVYPVHLNPNIKIPVYKALEGCDRIHLLPPLEYHELISLLNQSYIVLSDSGGIQEEAPALGKPVLVLREETERPEGIKAGVTKLVGTDPSTIVRTTEQLLKNANQYLRMAQAVSPYGNGFASRKIVDYFRRLIKKEML